jgi:hypothetical protein
MDGRGDLEHGGETTEGGEEDTWGGVGVGSVSGRLGGTGRLGRGGGSDRQFRFKKMERTYPEEVMDRAEEAALPTAPEALNVS